MQCYENVELFELFGCPRFSKTNNDKRLSSVKQVLKRTGEPVFHKTYYPGFMTHPFGKQVLREKKLNNYFCKSESFEFFENLFYQKLSIKLHLRDKKKQP